MQFLGKLEKQNKITLNRVPKHHDIVGNEKANRFVKLRSEMESDDSIVDPFYHRQKHHQGLLIRAAIFISSQQWKVTEECFRSK